MGTPTGVFTNTGNTFEIVAGTALDANGSVVEQWKERPVASYSNAGELLRAGG